MNHQPTKNTNTSVPNDGEIEILLSGFKPRPGDRFYSKLEKAPWMQRSSRLQKSRGIMGIPIRGWLLGITIVTIFVTLLTLSSIPSIRGVARQIYYSFISAPSTQIELQITPSSPSDLFHFSDPSNFPLTIQEAHKKAGFSLKEISGLPEDLELVGARFETDYKAAIILYQGNNYKLFLSQRPIGDGEDVFSIGPDTPVTIIMIGAEQGEYVAGGWKAISTQAVQNLDQTVTQANISAIWENDLPQYTLRWKSQGFIYELRSIGEGSPSRSDLISLANGLK